MQGLWAEFKTFIIRGNVIDLAVAVAIGASFTAIVNSIVNDVITPLISLILGGVDFSGVSVAIGDAVFTVGNLIMAVIQFFLVALVLFIVVKAVNKLMRREAAKPVLPPAPTPDQKLLAEIRDLLALQVGDRAAVVQTPTVTEIRP